jgi:hypothetical protein
MHTSCESYSLNPRSPNAPTQLTDSTVPISNRFYCERMSLILSSHFHSHMCESEILANGLKGAEQVRSRHQSHLTCDTKSVSSRTHLKTSLHYGGPYRSCVCGISSDKSFEIEFSSQRLGLSRERERGLETNASSSRNLT